MGSTEKISENEAHQILNLKKENFYQNKKLELKMKKTGLYYMIGSCTAVL